MSHQEWVEWWLQTDYGSKGKVAWDSNHLSNVWNHFVQVAYSNEGSPKVMCKYCSAILEHPYAARKDANGKDARHGKTMTRHLGTSACKRAVSAGQQRGRIDKFLQSTVWISFGTICTTNLIEIG
jgi:hypothetical protein